MLVDVDSRLDRGCKRLTRAVADKEGEIIPAAGVPKSDYRALLEAELVRRGENESGRYLRGYRQPAPEVPGYLLGPLQGDRPTHVRGYNRESGRNVETELSVAQHGIKGDPH